MKPLSKSANYLIKTPYSYYFRIRVPNDLHKYINRKELRYSFKTDYISTAREKARFLAAHVQLLFRFLRKEHRRLGELSEEKIQELVQHD